jgi:hypothetical protein
MKKKTGKYTPIFGIPFHSLFNFKRQSLCHLKMVLEQQKL